MPASKRIFSPAIGLDADANIQPRHPADAAAWIWHPDCAEGRTAFLRFHLDFEITTRTTLRAHVSADQRFQLHIDGGEVGFGPDRCDIDAWSVHSYEITLDAGAHRIEALVWWLADKTLANPGSKLKPPVAQSTWRGGFLFAGEGWLAPLLNTGAAAWRVTDMTAAVRLKAHSFRVYHDIGPEFHVDGAAWNAATACTSAVIVAAGIKKNPHGVRRPGWRLTPSALPEQTRSRVTTGRVRAVLSEITDGPFRETVGSGTEEWRKLFRGEHPLTIPPRTQCTVLWDFEDYICGYARISSDGGAESRVRIDWAESLYAGGANKHPDDKGNRDEIDGKQFIGFGDEFFPDDGAVHFPTFWWRSGRYLRVTVSTAATPLTLRSFEVISTGYPFGDAAHFRSDNDALDKAFVNAIRTLRVSAHELWVDCPYYEQMAYVGDNRLTALASYALFSDDRLARRMIELFDRSRCADGFVAERVPGMWRQTSVTYSLLWVLMVRDFAWWRDDADFVRARLPGMRAMLDNVRTLCDRDGALAKIPGWPFVDWVPDWDQGCGPGMREGDSSIVNLHWLLALRAAVELEDFFGEPEFAVFYSRCADRVEAAVRNRYWSASDGLLRDTRDTTAPFSEHAQALGILAGIQSPGGMQAWVDAWLARDDLAQATIYFSFYPIEALHRAGRESAVAKKINKWHGIVSSAGLLTLPESPEPTRSDCHGWGAHVRWHAAATLAGVRPDAPGFARVVVEPQMGSLHEIDTQVRHPRGVINVSLRRAGEKLRASIELPGGVMGDLRMSGKSVPLHAGKNELNLP